MMSKAEAEEYTRDTYYQGQDLYHGTNQQGERTKMRYVSIDQN
jgi:hypothetical protein